MGGAAVGGDVTFISVSPFDIPAKSNNDTVIIVSLLSVTILCVSVRNTDV
jgi:hypothetical protein